MKNQIILGLCICFILAGSLSAATVTFTGAIDDFWSNTDNWDAVPGLDDKARVRSEFPCILDYDAGIINQYVGEGGTIGHLILREGAQLSVRTWNILGYNGGDADNRHTIEVLGGVLNGGHPDYPNNGRIHVGRQGYAHLIIDYNGRVNMLHQDIEVGNNTGGDGIVELRGGILDCGTQRIRLQTNATATAQLDVSGGVLKQPASAENIAEIDGWIADGMLTAYNGVGTVLVSQENGNMIVKGLHPLNPAPADGANVTNGTTTLEWTVDAGTPVDVWLGTRADFSDAVQLVTKEAITSAQVTTEKAVRYFWAVDTYAPNAEEPNLGPVFDFLADNLKPVVATGDDVTTWVDNGSVEVALAGTVIDEDPTTTLWTVLSEPDDPNSPDALIADPAALNTAITLSALGAYVLELKANDGEYEGSDTMTINVFADSCLAAQSLPGYEAIPGDLNGDCVVNQEDIDLMLEEWLNCNGLDCPDT